MLFQSLQFLIFLTVLLTLLALATAHLRLKQYLLVAAGWIFYGAWDVRFVPLLWAYTLIGWWAGLLLERHQSERVRRTVYWVSIVFCLGLLGFFKYTNFLVGSFENLLGAPHSGFSIILPIGISFITFEIISYICDVHDRKLEPTRDLLDFALFNGFFPRLISGPIIRPAQFLPQLNIAPRLNIPGLVLGGQIFLIGMFQKTVLADNLAPFVDRIYAEPGLFSASTLWLGVIAYSGQIFCDFAGYSLMAIGLARMLGFRLPQNFNFPYLSRSVTEFWRRWHMSLSQWLRDYLYIRLGGSRRGRVRTYVNLFITMLLGGLWHGAGWNFVLWGGLHGAALATERALGQQGRATPQSGFSSKSASLLRWLGTFIFVVLAWIPFRSPSAQTTFAVFHGLLSGGRLDWYPPQVLIVLAAIILSHFGRVWNTALLWSPASARPFRFVPMFELALMAWCIILFRPMDASPFIYFQF